jgi:class 3 adenylate cyclase
VVNALIRILGARGSAWLGFGLAAALLVWGIDGAGYLAFVQDKAYDGLFVASARFISPPARPESPVALVAVDDATFENPTFHIPQTLWHNFFGAVIQALADGGAKAVGFDFLLPRALFDDLAPNYSRRWLTTIVYAQRKGAPVITGLVQLPDRQITPEARYLQILGSQNVGLFNLTTDPDDFIRRQRVFFPSGSDPAKGLYSVTYLLARALKPDLAPPSDLIYIDFDTSRQPFPRYSFAEVYDRAMKNDADWFRQRFQGKAVLIGETDSLTQDRHATPLYHLAGEGHRRTPGVEILIHTIRTLVGSRFYGDIPLAGRGLFYLGLSLLAGFLTLYASPRAPLHLSLPLTILLWAAASLAAFQGLVILPLAGGLIVLAVAEITFFAFRHWVVDREKRTIRHAFSRYLSPQVVAEVLQNPALLTLGGSRRVMTVFFSDLAGFTTISEALPAEKMVPLLNRYLHRMTQVILELDGTVDKYIGDAIMAFWGAPLVQEDHAVRACLAALRQREAMAEFREATRADGLPELHARMGVNTGPMTVGNMGSEDRFDYTVMGDAVNLASRLEGANKSFGTTIMISQSTFEAAGEVIEARELDLLKVKGKTEPMRVYELMAHKGRLDAATAEMKEMYEQGLALYRSRSFAEALVWFEKARERVPGDGPSGVYIDRCRTFLDTPPPAAWDGVFTMTTK